LHPRVARAAAAAGHLEKKLENFNVTLGVSQSLTPRVETVPAQEKRVRVRVLLERLSNAHGKSRDVLIVLQDWHDLAMIVRGDARQAL
jgi:hypothetical protein